MYSVLLCWLSNIHVHYVDGVFSIVCFYITIKGIAAQLVHYRIIDSYLYPPLVMLSVCSLDSNEESFLSLDLIRQKGSPITVQ